MPEIKVIYDGDPWWILEYGDWSISDGNDGDLDIDIEDCYDGRTHKYLPAEVMAECLRRMGYEVNKKKENA